MGWRITRTPSKRQAFETDVEESFREVAFDTKELYDRISTLYGVVAETNKKLDYLDENYVSECIDVLDDLGYINTSGEGAA